MRWTLMGLLFVGVGWTDFAITVKSVAVGAFFMLSGYHKLFNAERHGSIVDELKALGVPAVGFNQWWVPSVEVTAGGAVLTAQPEARASVTSDASCRTLLPKPPK